MSQTLENNEAPTTAKLAGKYLTFVLGDESYGIAIGKIRKIIRMTDVTPVPQMPDYIIGVIILRGKTIPVLDLCLRFGLKASDTDQRTRIIVAQVLLPNGDKTLLGVIVDGVEEVVNIEEAALEDVPHIGSGLRHDYLLGMAKVEGKVITLLDIDKVLSVDVTCPLDGTQQKCSAPWLLFCWLPLADGVKAVTQSASAAHTPQAFDSPKRCCADVLDCTRSSALSPAPLLPKGCRRLPGSGTHPAAYNGSS